MTEKETIDRDIAEIRKMIRLNEQELERFNLTPEDRNLIEQNIRMLTSEMNVLEDRLRVLDA